MDDPKNPVLNLTDPAAAGQAPSPADPSTPTPLVPDAPPAPPPDAPLPPMPEPPMPPAPETGPPTPPAGPAPLGGEDETPPTDVPTPEDQPSEGGLPPVISPPTTGPKAKLIASIIGLVLLVVSIPAGIILVGRQQEIREKAAVGTCRSNPVTPPDGYRWEANCSAGGACTSNSQCPKGANNQDGWCYGFEGSTGTSADWRCLKLVQLATPTPAATPTSTPSPSPTATPTSGAIGNCSTYTSSKPPGVTDPISGDNYDWVVDCNASCTTNANCGVFEDGTGKENWCYGFADGKRCIRYKNTSTGAGQCRDNPESPPVGYKWTALCGQSCTPPNNTTCPTGANGQPGWCYGFEGGAKCLRLDSTTTGGGGGPCAVPGIDVYKYPFAATDKVTSLDNAFKAGDLVRFVVNTSDDTRATKVEVCEVGYGCETQTKRTAADGSQKLYRDVRLGNVGSVTIKARCAF